MMALRTTGDSARAPFVPSEQWIEAFTSQVTAEDFHDAMWRYAERRGRMVQHLRKLDPEAYARDLVQEILDDTMYGRIAWDPVRVDLRKHVYDAIKSRSRHHYRRALRLRHFSLAEARTNRLVDEASIAGTLETELERAERLESITAVVAAVRERAGDDVEVQRLLDAYEQGIANRSKILEVAGLTKLQYDAGRKRLDRLLEELPSQLINRARNR